MMIWDDLQGITSGQMGRGRGPGVGGSGIKKLGKHHLWMILRETIISVLRHIGSF